MFWATSSRDIAAGLGLLLSTYGIVASTHADPARGQSATLASGHVVTKRHTSYCVTVTQAQALARIEAVWGDHKGAACVRARSGGPRRSPRWTSSASGDLIGAPVRSVRRAAATAGRVYDFSVATDENFICGLGGLLAKKYGRRCRRCPH